jgi:hypothetical protein
MGKTALIFIIISAIGLSSCSNGAFEGTVEERVAYLAELANDRAWLSGRDGAAILVSARADGNVLELVMDEAIESDEQEFEETALINGLRPIICDEIAFRAAIEDGAKVRLVLKSKAGHQMQPATIAYCPPA